MLPLFFGQGSAQPCCGQMMSVGPWQNTMYKLPRGLVLQATDSLGFESIGMRCVSSGQVALNLQVNSSEAPSRSGLLGRLGRI
jgi:hypothetical protein